MSFPLPLAVILIIAGVWTLVVWPPFLRRLMKDPKSRDENGRATNFMSIQLMLISTSMVLGLATAVIGVRAAIG